MIIQYTWIWILIQERGVPVNSSQPKIVWRVDRLLKHRVVTSWLAPHAPCCHCCDELTACCCRHRLECRHSSVVPILTTLRGMCRPHTKCTHTTAAAAVGQWTTASDAAHQRWCRRQWTVPARVPHAARIGGRLDGVVVFAADDDPPQHLHGPLTWPLLRCCKTGFRERIRRSEWVSLRLFCHVVDYTRA